MALKSSASLKSIQEDIELSKAKRKRHTLSPSMSIEPHVSVVKDTLDSGTPIFANDSNKNIIFYKVISLCKDWKEGNASN